MPETPTWKEWFPKDRDYSKHLEAEYIRGMMKAVLDIAPIDVSPIRLFEVGCGTGIVANAFQQGGAEVIALDSDQDLITRSSKQHPEVKHLLGDAFDLEKLRVISELWEPREGDAPGHFLRADVVYHQGFLEHFDWQQTIEQLSIQRELATVLVFSVPGPDYPGIYPGDLRGDEWLRPAEEWVHLTQEAGWTEVTGKHYGELDLNILIEARFPR